MNRTEENILHGAIKNPAQDLDNDAVFIKLILNTKEYYSVLSSDIKKWQELYPAVNVEQELRNLCGWLESNPSKRKTKGGINRCINSWLCREQNKGGDKNIKNNDASYDLNEFTELAWKAQNK